MLATGGRSSTAAPVRASGAYREAAVAALREHLLFARLLPSDAPVRDRRARRTRTDKITADGGQPAGP
jgi:hypothetical protein